MTIISYPFENRATTEEQYSRLFRELGATGIAGDPGSTDLRVTAVPGTARIAAGFAIVRGHAVHVTADEARAIAPANAVTRHDLVVLRLDPSLNNIDIVILPGEPGAGAPPAPTQTDTGIFDLPLSEVRVFADGNINTGDIRTFSNTYAGAWTSVGSRPTSPRLGSLGFNASSKKYEFFDGTKWNDVGAGTTPVLIETFTASDLWSKPPGASLVQVELWGGGGGGAFRSDEHATGGGGGEYACHRFAASELPSHLSVLVGAGGTSGQSTGANGSAGGASEFHTARALGGRGGSSIYGVPGGVDYALDGTVQIFSGGYGRKFADGPGDNSLHGGAGGGGSSNTTPEGSAGGQSVHGGAGGRGRGLTYPATDGQIRGGGAGGGSSTAVGGRGEVRITTYF